LSKETGPVRQTARLLADLYALEIRELADRFSHRKQHLAGINIS